jgi:peptidoglycan hydrolase-like protein with peptidoglycan-binding domain
MAEHAMSELAGKQSRVQGLDPVASAAGPAPGKRTLVDHLAPVDASPQPGASNDAAAAAPVGVGPAAGAELLSAGQAAMAVSFYQSQPDLYPPDVIRKIQHAVKSPETGVADAAMAQGVARFQSSNFLKIDGMAGPRTLPRLFESGLATQASRTAFVATGKKVEADWATLATPEARAAKLFEGVKVRLDAEGVPTPTLAVEDLGKASGMFSSGPWKLALDRTALSAPTIDDDAARELSGTVYHEARHCEQNHKMARMLATKGNTAAQIQAKMGIPAAIAETAVANLLPRGVEYATASQQFDAQYGPGKAHHIQAEAEVPSTEELQAAQAAAKADPTPANQAKAARLLAAYRAYHDLPVENDAFATEDDFKATWDETTAATSPTP